MNKKKRVLFYIIAFLLIGFITLLCMETALHVSGMLHAPTIPEKQRSFSEKLSYPYSYGIVRPHVSLDLREYFPNGEKIDETIPIETNSFGLRMREISLAPPQDAIRIAVMGDSSTFGWMVKEEDAYPRVLERILNEKCEKPVEVLNFGVPGYTSHHGLMQFRRLVRQFQPDYLILAFGFNDSYECRFPSAEFYDRLRASGMVEGIHGVPLFLFDHTYLGNWSVNRWFASRSKEIEAEMLRRAEEKTWHPRVDKTDYKQNLGEMIEEMHANNRKTVLMNLCLPNTWVKEPLIELSQQYKLPLLDVQEMFYTYINETETDETETDETANGVQQSGIYPSGQQNKRFLFRVMVNDKTEVPSAVYITGNHPALGNMNPNTVAMYDNGTHGDETAADRIWSLEVEIDDGQYLDYAFTNGGKPGIWQGDAEPLFENTFKAIRHFDFVNTRQTQTGQRWISPLHCLGEDPLRPLLIPDDPIHPNPEGHQMIAEALAQWFCED